MPGATCWQGKWSGKEGRAQGRGQLGAGLRPRSLLRRTLVLARQLFAEARCDRQLERQSALGTGPGYQFWDDELGRFDTVAEISRWQLEWRDQPREDFTSYSLEWDYKRLLAGTRLELYSKGTVLVPGIERIDYLLDSEYGLRYRLNSWARLSFLYELDQLRTEGGTQSDRHYLIGVGVGW